MVKDVFHCCSECNFSLDVHYVPSNKNPADFPSRKVSHLDCALPERAWGQVERLFAASHTFNLMSLDSNCQGDGTGQCLLHFTSCATPCSSGINVFAQSLLPNHNVYVFPPFILIILPLLKCILEQDSFCIYIPGLQAYTLLVGVVAVA